MLNIAVLQGRLVETPELKTTESGISVTRFRLAVNRDYANQSGTREADFFNIVAWRGTAEFVCKYFQKGQMILLNGRNQSRGYTDQNGNKRTAYEIVAEQVQFCGSKSQEQDQNAARYGAPPPENSGYEEIAVTDDDLPF